jgi:hypothetical protein
MTDLLTGKTILITGASAKCHRVATHRLSPGPSSGSTSRTVPGGPARLCASEPVTFTAARSILSTWALRPPLVSVGTAGARFGPPRTAKIDNRPNPL